MVSVRLVVGWRVYLNSLPQPICSGKRVRDDFERIWVMVPQVEFTVGHHVRKLQRNVPQICWPVIRADGQPRTIFLHGFSHAPKRCPFRSFDIKLYVVNWNVLENVINSYALDADPCLDIF